MNGFIKLPEKNSKVVMLSESSAVKHYLMMRPQLAIVGGVLFRRRKSPDGLSELLQLVVPEVLYHSSGECTFLQYKKTLRTRRTVN